MEKNLLKLFLDDVRIDEIMSKDIIYVFEDDSLSIVQEKFIHNNISHLVVLERDTNKLTGVVSRKYVYKAQSPRKIIGQEVNYARDVIIDGESYYDKDILEGLILKNIMKREPFTLTPEDSVSGAIVNFCQRKLSFIPIVDQRNRVVGTLSDFNVIDFIARVIGW